LQQRSSGVLAQPAPARRSLSRKASQPAAQDTAISSGGHKILQGGTAVSQQVTHDRSLPTEVERLT